MTEALGRIAWNLALEAELVRVLAALEEFDVIVFKGPLLTRQIYGDLSERLSSDNDLLVPPDQALRVVERARSLGYEPLAFGNPEKEVEELGRVTLVRRTEAMTHSIDLHVEAFGRPHFVVAREVVTQHIETFSLHGQAVRRFDKQLAFCHLVAHFIQHRFEAHMLRDIGTAWDAWQADLGGEALDELVRATCTREGFEFAVEAAHRLGYGRGLDGGPRTPRARLVLRAFPPERALEEAHLGYLRGFWATFLVRPTALFSLALRGVFLPPDELARRHGRPYELSMRLERLTGPLRELRHRMQRRP